MSYDFGVLRDLRKRKNLTITGLSKKSGVSYVALSKLERNQGNPELRTLDRIARALDMSTHNFLAMAHQERPAPVSEQTGKLFGKAACRFVNLDGTRVFFIKAPKGASGSEASVHDDDYERCFVLDGRLKVRVCKDEFTLGPGDGLCWDSCYEHAYEALEPSTFIKVLIPKRL